MKSLKLPEDFVLDGEICMVDDDGNEDFQGIMKQIRKKIIKLKILNSLCLII